jgi:tetraacyldisaccharide 4'-kinase
VAVTAGARVLAFAGIARPERFFDVVRRQGWDLVHTVTFRDHYWFKTADLDRMLALARSLRADVILTTEKDAVRLLDLEIGAGPVVLAYLPMNVAVEPAERFEEWLRDRLLRARTVSSRSTHP